MKDKIVYILGPMRRFPYYNFPAFDAVRDMLKAQGYTVINPADLDRQEGFDPFVLPSDHDWSDLPSGLKLHTVISRDIDAIRKCNAFWALPGWENSTGARAEKSLLEWMKAEWLNNPENQTTILIPPITIHPTPEQAASLRSIEIMAQHSAEHFKAAMKHDETNPKDLIGITKPQLHLIPPALKIWVAKTMENGAKKYGPYNWRLKKVRMTIYISAAMRHLESLLDGEDRAKDSGLPHEAHAAACMGILLDAAATGNLIDDRPAKGAASRLIDELTVKS